MRTKAEFIEALRNDFPQADDGWLAAAADTLFEERFSLQATRSNSEYITTGPGGQGGGVTLKLGNARFNLGKLTGFLAGSGDVLFTPSPVEALLKLLSIVFSAPEVGRVSLSEVEASVVWSASLFGLGMPVREDQLLGCTNSERVKFSMVPVNAKVFEAAVERLVELACFERVGLGIVRLSETVTIGY